jgi:hypothetical protein
VTALERRPLACVRTRSLPTLLGSPRRRGARARALAVRPPASPPRRAPEPAGSRPALLGTHPAVTTLAEPFAAAPFDAFSAARAPATLQAG